MVRPQDEIDDAAQPGADEQTLDQTAQQDFALRNAAMSNALPPTGQPAAGAAIGSGGELEMDPVTDAEDAGEAIVDAQTTPRRE
jgi:hypothetical protein